MNERKEGLQPGVCPVAKKCGGCQLQNMPYSQQLAWKQHKAERLLGKFCRVSPIIGMEQPLHYRNKVQAAFGVGRGGRAVSGVYQSGSHTIVPVDTCMTEDVVADQIIVTIRGMLREFKLPPYDLRSGRGVLRHVLIRRGFESGQVMVVLVTASPIFPLQKHFARALVEKHPEITTLILNVNRDYEGLMLGRSEKVLYGEGFIEDTLCGLTFRISSRAFYQVNPIQTRILYETALRYAGLTGSERVIDAYCGVGTIGLIAAASAGQVLGVESNREAVRDAIANAKRNQIHNARFFCADAGEYIEQLADEGERVDVVFLDPPRAGSDRKSLDALVALAPPKIVYISCNPETQARDLGRLAAGGYRISAIQPVDLFPYTNHIETVVLMSKAQ